MGLLTGTIFDRPLHCERCDRPETECQCPPVEIAPGWTDPGKQTARLSTEKRKKGKLVTLIKGLPAKENDLPKLLTQLKNACGAGGTIDGDVIELQGDQTERALKTLTQIGYRVRST
ncbi:translation initiation factor [Schlesneria sp. T3-172]|uniref:translation initiation factor n=1 Tax=Schlesneria sphaerica TaxID=3373610 RepID=UPI0037CA163D